MNRKQFLTTILGVVAAAPFVVKAIKEERYIAMDLETDGLNGYCYWGHTDKLFDLEEFRRQVGEEQERLSKQMANGNITKWVSFEGKMSTHPFRWNKNKLA